MCSLSFFDLRLLFIPLCSLSFDLRLLFILLCSLSFDLRLLFTAGKPVTQESSLDVFCHVIFDVNFDFHTCVFSLLLRFTASVYTFGIFTLFLLLQSLYGIKIHIPKIIHKSSRYIPELTGSKSDPLKPYTIAMDTDWNINNLKHFFHVITIFFCKIKINRRFYILFYINHATIWPKCC